MLVESIICQDATGQQQIAPGGPAEILTGALARGLAELKRRVTGKTLVGYLYLPPVVGGATTASFGINAICQQYIALVDNQK